MCHIVTGECLCDAGFYGTYCNMTCKPGQYGVNCNQTCPCHTKNCDSVSGACYLQPNQRMGVIAAGTLVGFLLIVLLSVLCCCCLCQHKDDHNKKAKRILCGRFNRISTKLPRIPLRRQKLPKVVVAHHDPENTFNCSFIEPPSSAAAEQNSPSSWSSQESFSSFESGDEGPVYCVPHEDSVNENKEKRSPSPPTEKSPVDNEEDAGEYTSLKDTSVTKLEGHEQQPLKACESSDSSTSGSESTAAVLYARIARGSKSKEDEGSGKDVDSTLTPEAKRNGKPPPSPGKPKPRPPDPSTKPKVSWIHGNATGSPPPDEQQTKSLSVPKEKKGRSSSDGSGKSEERQKMKEKNREQKRAEAKEVDANGSPSKHKPLRGKKSGDESSSPSHMEHINGVVQNALKKISYFHISSSEKKSAEIQKETPKEPPKVIHPHMNSEAATLLAAQLKEKTQSINRNEGTGLNKTNGLSTPKGTREKPTPPQKAKRTSSTGSGQQGSTKPLLPTTSSLQKMVAPITADGETPELKSPEKQDLNGSKAGDSASDSTPKKTPIKKPPRKKGKDGTLETSEAKSPQQKTAIMPPQIVK